MTTVYLALGGNLGSVEQSFDLAARELSHLPETRVVRVSSVFRFPAVGRSAGGEFTNGAAEIETSLKPLELLRELQDIEDKFGRLRDTRWGPRPLDLDIVFFGDRVIDHPRLHVPHLACWYRRFVLDPLSEIAAEVVHPEKQISVAALRDRLMTRPLPVNLAGGSGEVRTRLVSQMSGEFSDVAFSTDWRASHGAAGAQAEPVLLVWLGVDETSRGQEFASLPLLPRLDASKFSTSRDEFLREVLHSALGR